MSAPSKPAAGYWPPGTGDECREFVVAFAEPLGRLGYLLSVGWPRPLAADQLAVDALAQVRRRWHEVETTGTPELLAVEALLSKLPRRHKPPPPPVDVETLERADLELDDDELRAAVWSAFTQLPPRRRVPLVFADASVASPRSAGLDVPTSYASAHRLAATFDAALLSMRESLRRNDRTATPADSLTDARIVELLTGALRSHAADYSVPIDPYPLVLDAGLRQRRRARFIGAVAVVAVVAMGGTVVQLSSRRTTRTPALAATHVPNDPETAGSGNGALLTDTDPGAVVDWPARGTAALDPLLTANVKAAFISAHPDLTGPVQVLLATDTPAFRVAYLTARSSGGVLQSWFYGPVGSTDLAESTASFGGGLDSSSTVLASGLVDAQGHTELVVIAPPLTRRMQLEQFQFSKTVGSGFQPLPSVDGVAVKDVPSGSVSTLVLQAVVAGRQVEIDHMPVIPLGASAPVELPRPPSSIASFAAVPSAPLPVPTAVPSSIPAPTIGVERGQPDPALLAQALAVAAAWHAADVKDGPTGPAAPLVVWGGTDPTGARLVVVRTQTNYTDLLILEWSGDGPGQHGEYLLNAGAADVPLAFAYRSNVGTRIGVLASGGVASAALDVGGVVGPASSARVSFDPTGFASLPLPATVHGSAANLAVTVQLYDAAGHVTGSAPVPPPV